MSTALPVTRPASEPRRRAILDAALAAFTAKGFDAATLADIRAASGASTGSLYHHFRSKEELAGALYLDGVERYQQGQLDALAKSRDAEKGVKGIVRFHLDWVVENAALAQFLLTLRPVVSRGASEEKVRESRRTFFARIAGWVDANVSDGELRRLPLPVFVALVIGPAEDYMRDWLGRRDDKELALAKRHLPDAAWDAVRASAK